MRNGQKGDNNRLKKGKERFFKKQQAAEKRAVSGLMEGEEWFKGRQ